MLKHGLVAELRALQEMYTLHQDLPSMRCVGYRQAWKFLTQEISETELFDKGTAATRQLAKRQLTWLRHMPGIVEIDCLANNVVRQILTTIHQRQN
jgi:tRNA dimethylallyltransferase